MLLHASGLRYTAHAHARMRQRAIDAHAVECIVDFGRAERQPGGSSVVFLDRASERWIRREMGEETLKRLGKRARAYVVLGADGAVVRPGTGCVG